MKTSFRQGIIRYQTSGNLPNYLAKSSIDSRFIDLIVSPDPTLITFAHGRANYTIEESNQVTRAWGPFLPDNENATKYLYWDINLITAQLSRNYTLLTPMSGPRPPNNPAIDQHWFDMTSTSMKVWNGLGWTTRIRVFAGIYLNEAIIVPYQLGSQVSLNTSSSSGKILLDDQLKPLRDSSYSFLTTETNFQIQSISNNPNFALRFETVLTFVTVSEFIPAFSAVTYTTNNTVTLSRYSLRNIVHGIIIDDTNVGDIQRLVSSGVIYNEQWNFLNSQIGKAIFCGETGQLTVIPPPFGICQMIGIIESSKTININIQTPIFHTPITQ